MASAAAVTPLGLLHMRPFQHWLHSRVPHYPGSPRVLPLPAVLLSEHRAGGQQTAQSRALAAGRLVSRSGVRLTTAPCLSAFLPRGAWGADEVADGPFHGQKPLVGLLHPHYPRRRSGQGVRGHSPGGESDRGAPVPTKRRHLEEPSTSPRPRPVGWQPLSRPKLIALRARQPLPCTPWLSCRFTKPRCSNRCTRGSTDPGLMQELRTATDFALRATKVTARSLAKAMSSMVVQERHLWLNLAEMKDIDKARFFDAPISQAGLFGDTVEGFAQQFSAIQQQTEAIQHTCPGVMHHPPLPPGPGLSPPVAVGTLLHPPELLAPGRIDTLAGASSLSQESGAPRVPVRPQVVQEVDEVGCAVGAACTASGGVAHAAQPVSLAHAHNSTRLRDSVRQATSQVQRRSRDAGGSLERPGLAWGDCCPPGKGRNRAGPSSQKEAGVLQPLLHRTQETWWPSTNPGSASYEPGFTQAPSRCGHAGALSNASSPRIGLQRSTWRMLTTCFDPSATQTVPTVCVWRSGIAVQDPPLRAHESRRKAPLPRYGRVGVRIINYLDDWLILAQSREQLGDPRDLVLRHLSQLGLRVNREKSKLSPVQRITFLGVELDSVSMTARLTEERAQAVLNCLSSFRGRNVVPLKQLQRLLGHMASTAAVTPLGLLHMRPFQHWLHSRVPHYPGSPRVLPLPAVLLSDRGPPRHRRTGTQLASALRKYSFPPVSLLAQTLCKLREDEEQVLLVAPHWPTRTWFPELISLATAPPWCIPLRKELLSQGLGTIWHPRPDLWNLHVWLLDGTLQTWVVYHRQW